MHRRFRDLVRPICVALCAATAPAFAADHVDITWMSIANLHFDVGKQHVLADGYITRLPREVFYSGESGYGKTQRAVRPDERAVREVLGAMGGRTAVNLLLTGHNHFDHSFDTATWAKLTGARVIGARTACLQTRAQRLPESRCTAVSGGESFELEPGVRLYVIRWNHSGGPALNPELHAPVELDAVPRADANGALRAGVTEDFPNGGGNRAYLFKVAGPQGSFSWMFQDSGSAIDLAEPVVVGGQSYGAPLDNLRAAMRAAGLESVDLWIATGGADVARLVLPVLKPSAYLPVHWDGLFGAFKAGPPQPFSDPELAKLLAETGVKLVVPVQYMDKWRLDRDGVHPLENTAVKRALGFH
jgi:L-ascorbate metabolism protein UlaG (beta-lactamase superfamily)